VSALASDQIEVTVIGPGFGESVLVHIGASQWIIVDSCQQAGVKEPAALAYLKGRGVDYSSAVRLIVASHWRDDHIRGLSDLLKACPAADFACSAALSTKEFVGIATAFEESPLSRAGSGVGEIQRAFLYSKERGRAPRFIVGNRFFRITDRSGEILCEITALSPTDREYARFLESISAFVPNRGTTKYRVPSPSQNDISVVLWIKIGADNLLLGADLEEHNDAQRGWTAVIASPDRPKGRAQFYKIAHHGSVTAHHDGIWSQLLGAAPVAVLTPWNRGRKLPTAADRDRLLSLTPNGYATACGGVSSKRQPQQAVERVLRESGIKIVAAEPAPGIVTALKEREGDGWQISLSPNAVPMKDCL
jgi:hypothetical protein